MPIDHLKHRVKTLMTPGQVAFVRGCLARLGLRKVGSERSARVCREMKIPKLQAIHVAEARLYANRTDALELLPRNGIVAEMGVAFGDFSQVLLDHLSPQRFDAFDTFRLHEIDVIWGRPPAQILGALSHRSHYERRFGSLVSAGRVQVLEGDSSELISLQPDSSYDVIYIDADHSYEAVCRDAAAAAKKIKPDGILVFNDYIIMDHILREYYGIIPVVNDYCVNKGWKVVYLALDAYMYCDIAIRRTEMPSHVVEGSA